MVAWEKTETEIFEVDFFKPNKEDRKLVTQLLGEALFGDAKRAAQTRLCEIAAVDGC